MTPSVGHELAAFAITLAAGTVVIGVVVTALAVLVVVLWRRSDDGDGAHPAIGVGPRADSHAVSSVAGTGGAQLLLPARTDGRRPTPISDPAIERAREPRGPHPSGLGAAELAAIVEEGLASLRSDLDRLGRLIESIGVAATVPDDLPARPAAQQVALMDQMTAMIASDLEAARRLAATVAADVGRGHEARDVVHGELARIGLPVGFFSAMDSSAADLAVDVVRARISVERLVRRFDALSSLYSSVRPTLDHLTELDDSLGRSIAVTNAWRRAPETVDLLADVGVPQPLLG